MSCRKTFETIKHWAGSRFQLDMDFRNLFEKNSKRLDILGLNFQKKGFTAWPNLIKFFVALVLLCIGNIFNFWAIWTEDLEFKQITNNTVHLVGFFMVTSTVEYLAQTASVNYLPLPSVKLHTNLALHRLYHILIDYKTLNELIDWTHQSSASFVISKEWEENISKKYVRYCRILSLTLTAVYWFFVCAVVYVPMFFKEWFLLGQIIIPGLDTRSHPGYEIAVMINIWVMFYMVNTLDVYDAYFYFYSTYIVTRLEICRYMAAKIGDFSSECNTPDKQTELLVNLIRTHDDVKRFTAAFSKSFFILILCEGVTAMAQLTLALLMSSWAPLYSLAIVIITTNQFFLLCFFGELILHNEAELSKEIYLSQWYNIHRQSDRLSIVILLQNTQKNSNFTAYGMYDLSMDTFSNFVKKAYSFYALIRNVS